VLPVILPFTQESARQISKIQVLGLNKSLVEDKSRDFVVLRTVRTLK
jgi:hypothetical protein